MAESTSSKAFAAAAAENSALAISDEKIRLQGELITARQERDNLAATILQIADLADEGAESRDAMAAGFALGRIVELCASVSDIAADGVEADDPIY